MVRRNDNTTASNTGQTPKRNPISRALRAVNPLRLLRRSTPQTEPTPRPNQTHDTQNIQNFDNTITTNVLNQLGTRSELQTQPASQIKIIKDSKSVLNSNATQTINPPIDNFIIPSNLSNISTISRGNSGIDNESSIALVNNTQKIASEAIRSTIESGIEGNLDIEQKLNYAIATYPEISRITHPDATHIKLKYATNINANDIPRKINSIINGLSNKQDRKIKTKIDLLSRTTSPQVASLVLASDSFKKLNFSDKQIERLTATAFPK